MVELTKQQQYTQTIQGREQFRQQQQIIQENKNRQQEELKQQVQVQTQPNKSLENYNMAKRLYNRYAYGNKKINYLAYNKETLKFFNEMRRAKAGGGTLSGYATPQQAINISVSPYTATSRVYEEYKGDTPQMSQVQAQTQVATTIGYGNAGAGRMDYQPYTSSTKTMAVVKETGQIVQELRDQAIARGQDPFAINTATMNLEDHTFVLRNGKWYDSSSGKLAPNYLQNDNYLQILHNINNPIKTTHTTRAVIPQTVVTPQMSQVQINSQVPEWERTMSSAGGRGTIITPPPKYTDYRNVVGTVEPVKNNPITYLQTEAGKIETARLRNQNISLSNEAKLAATTFGLGVASIPIGLYTIGKQTLQGNPLEVAGGVGKGLIQFPENVIKGFVREPTGTIAYTSGQLLFPKIIETGTLKGSDFLRTIGKKEIPKETIIAPETFTGQTYPKIKQGQTAIQLKQEFQPLFPGETKAGGFTASPIPIKETITRPGSSELKGLYQSPKLNPTFLRIKQIVGEGERKLFSLFKQPLRPTAFRVTPLSYELISKGKELNPLGKAKEFFYTQAEKGKAYIPFIKTEKEAVIPVGTELAPLGTRYYITYEGRKVPIAEYNTLGKGTQITNAKSSLGITTTEEISKKLSSSSYQGSNAYLDIFNVGSFTGLTSKGSVYPGVTTPSYSTSTISPTKVYPSINVDYYSNKITSSQTSPIVSYKKGSTSPIYSITPPPSYTPSPSYTSSPSPIFSPKSSYSPIKSINYIFPRNKEGYKQLMKRKKLLKSKAYITLIKRYGEWKALGKPIIKSEAIRKGEEYTRKTLGASFKVIQKGETEQLDLGGYTPNQNIFRGYKISRGQRIPLKDEWIQKRKTRLGTKSEISEIQMSRKNSIKFKGGSKKWL